eukprot:COSAG03_NODE_25313_length_266_cov_0.928144_2_plen_23_part_01
MAPKVAFPYRERVVHNLIVDTF